MGELKNKDYGVKMSSKEPTKYVRYSSKSQQFRNLFTGSSRVTPSNTSSEIQNFILSDSYLTSAYAEMYSALRRAMPTEIGEVIIEIGAGSGIGKTWIPQMYCTDLIMESDIDLVVDATKMPFADASVTTFIMKDSLHHIPNTEQFLDESLRCLKTDGSVICCEPYWGLLARCVYKFFHPEPFDKKQLDWMRKSHDAWDSNQALPWMLLRRDVGRLSVEWPEFEIRELGAILGPSYLLSGGVFGRTPIPSSLLIRMQQWESRRGKWFNVFRFEFAFTLTKRSYRSDLSQSDVPIPKTRKVM